MDLYDPGERPISFYVQDYVDASGRPFPEGVWMWRQVIPHQGNELQIANAVLEIMPNVDSEYTSPGGDTTGGTYTGGDTTGGTYTGGDTTGGTYTGGDTTGGTYTGGDTTGGTYTGGDTTGGTYTGGDTTGGTYNGVITTRRNLQRWRLGYDRSWNPQ